jgi:hypothetical protein
LKKKQSVKKYGGSESTRLLSSENASEKTRVKTAKASKKAAKASKKAAKASEKAAMSDCHNSLTQCKEDKNRLQQKLDKYTNTLDTLGEKILSGELIFRNGTKITNERMKPYLI